MRLVYKKQNKGSDQIWWYRHSKGRNITSESLPGLHSEFKASLDNFLRTCRRSKSIKGIDEYLLSIHKALDSIPSIEEMRKEKRKPERNRNVCQNAISQV